MLILYGTEGCHLCDKAQAILHQAGLAWYEVDIIDDDVLLERYGEKIPVLLRSESGRELYWPFSMGEVLAFMLPE